MSAPGHDSCEGAAPDIWQSPTLLLEQCVERLARVVRRLRLAGFVRGQVADELRLEEGALVADVFARYARGDALAALPRRRGVEGAAVAAGMQVGAALHACLFGRRLVESESLRAARIALEDLGAEAAGGSSARRAFEALVLRLVRRLRPRTSVRIR
jgi:hypothetical protein